MISKDKKFNILVNVTLLLIIIFIITKISYIFTPLTSILKLFIFPIIVSLFLYYILVPILKRLEKIKVNKSLKIVSIMFIFTFILIFAIVYGGAIIKEQFEGSFTNNINEFINSNAIYRDKLQELVPSLEFSQKTFGIVNTVLKKISGNIGSFFSYLSNVGTQIVLVPFILFYFLKDGNKFAQNFMKVIPVKYKDITEDMIHQTDEILSTYISGQLIVAMVIGGLMYIGYLIIGIPNAFLMGFFSMITAIIPFIGAFLGILPALLIAVTINTSMVIKVGIVAIIVQQLEGNFITPNIIGNKLNVHPLTVIFVIIISVSLFGIIGAFIGLPVYVVLRVLIKSIYKIYLVKKL